MGSEPNDIFVLPDLGEGLREADIVAWHVAEGDHVVADQPLVSVETDKAVVESSAIGTHREATRGAAGTSGNRRTPGRLCRRWAA